MLLLITLLYFYLGLLNPGQVIAVRYDQDYKNEKEYVTVNFKKSYGNDFETSKKWTDPELMYLEKRANGFEEVIIDNQRSFYSVDLQIGMPEQEVTVLVDTGSSDLWVTGANNPYCIENRDSISGPSNSLVVPRSLATIDCSTYGVFDASKSNTWNRNSSAPPFFISYGDTSFASGVWGQDVLHLEDLNVTGLSFAVANRTNSTVGVLGIGLPGLEATYTGSSGSSYMYANFPLVLKRSGAIKSNSYSLFLNSLDAEQGSILFGAVDHSKYSGPLYALPLVNTLEDKGYPQPVQFDVTLQGLSLVSQDTNNTKQLLQQNVPALLDSGTTMTYLPAPIVNTVASSISATYSERLGMFVLPCPSTRQSEKYNTTQLVFDFGGFQINTTLGDFIIKSNTLCTLGLIPQDTNSVVLGDTFLTHAYVVYDLDNRQIGLAPANFNSDEPNIELITNGIPNTTRATGYSHTWSGTVQPLDSNGNIFTSGGTQFSTGSIITGLLSSRTITSTRVTATSATTNTKKNNARSTKVKDNWLRLLMPVLFFIM